MDRKKEEELFFSQSSGKPKILSPPPVDGKHLSLQQLSPVFHLSPHSNTDAILKYSSPLWREKERMEAPYEIFL
ncbi:MAG: hypothetical protein HFF07_02655 [Oscillospiraceae bacterium]|nr:hypothetical protein [Oscillospiraceae bacterium]